MDIKELAESILVAQQENNAIITEIIKTGSGFFDLQRNRDEDYIVICKNYGQRKRRDFVTKDGVKYDILIVDENAMIASLDFNNTTYVYQDSKLYSYFYDSSLRKTVYGDCGIEWSMLDHKEEYLDFIKEKFAKTKYNVLKDPWKVGKSFVHYYVVLKIIDNNSAELTPEILADVALLYGANSDAKPVIDWTIEKLLSSPEPYVVEGVPPVSQGDAEQGVFPIPLTEVNNE